MNGPGTRIFPTGSRGRVAIVLVIATLASGWLLQGARTPAQAHGKELAITVSSLIPTPGRPLTRLYRAEVVYASDLEPAEGATVMLTAWLERDGENVSQIVPITFTEVTGRPGLYVGEVTYDRFGAWHVSMHIEAALGQGSGGADFVEDLSPGALTESGEAALRAEGERVYRLQLLFGFDWWPDVANIVARIVHSTAGLAYFVVTGAVFALVWLGVPVGRPQLPSQLARVFPLAAFGSLAALLAVGLYSAAFDAPITAPGIYDVNRMRQIPFGEWYLAAFALKPVLFIVLLLLAFRIGNALKALRPPLVEAGEAGVVVAAPAAAQLSALAGLRRLTMANALVGVVLVADVAVVVYLHYVSHLGVFLPPA